MKRYTMLYTLCGREYRTWGTALELYGHLERQAEWAGDELGSVFELTYDTDRDGYLTTVTHLATIDDLRAFAHEDEYINY